MVDRTLMLTAVFTSSPFLVRPMYFGILTSHTTLAADIVSQVIITLSRALRERFDRHGKIARWNLSALVVGFSHPEW